MATDAVPAGSSTQKADPNNPLTQPDPIGASGSILKPKPGLSPLAPQPPSLVNSSMPNAGIAPLPMAPTNPSPVATPTTQMTQLAQTAAAPTSSVMPPGISAPGPIDENALAAANSGLAPWAKSDTAGFSENQKAALALGGGANPAELGAIGVRDPNTGALSADPAKLSSVQSLLGGAPVQAALAAAGTDRQSEGAPQGLSPAEVARDQRMAQLRATESTGNAAPMTDAERQAYIDNGTPFETHRELVNGQIPGTPGAPGALGAGSAVSGAAQNGSASGQNLTGNSTLDTLLNGAATSGPSVKTTATDPNNPLTNQTLSVGNTADPVQQALAAWQTFQQATDPQYKASLRDAVRMASSGGAIGSGALNTSIGDIASTRANALDTARQSLLENALGTKNENAYRDVGIAQQQQGFQNQQQTQAFNQALQQLLAGSSGDPSQIMLALSQLYGGQASAGSAAAAGLGANKANGQSTGSALAQLLGSLGGGGNSGAGSATPSGIDEILARGIPGISTTAGAY